MTRQPITIADVTVQPGERDHGFLHVGHLAAMTEVRIPFQVLNGAHEGPTICMDAGLQGWEPMGAEILRRALLGVDPKKLRGTILCLPFVMPFGVEIGGTIEGAGGRVNPADQLDLNKVWPGKLENGWLTEQMAAVMWRDIISKADYLLDLHDGTGSCDELPVAFPRPFPDDPNQVLAGPAGSDGVGEDASGLPNGLTPERMQEINAEMREMAIAFGSTVIRWRQDPVIPTMLSGWCLLNGIVPLVVEAGGGHTIDESILQGVDCTLNILKHLDMIDGDLVLPRRQIMVTGYTIYRSKAGGHYIGETEKNLGSTVEKGQMIGAIVNPLTSEVVEECRSPVNGIIVSRRIRMPINPGGYIAHIADTDTIIWERENR